MESEFDTTEEKIISATFNILRKEGVDKATTKKIAKEAGVNEVTVFRKFENKKNLIEITKSYYFKKFLDKLEKNFDFTGDESIDEYLLKNFDGLYNIPDEDFSIIKVAMSENDDIPEKKRLVFIIANTILNKIDEFFRLQKEKGNIRDIDTRILAINCFSVIFQSIVLRKIYHNAEEIDTEHYSNTFLDILYDGIKP